MVYGWGGGGEGHHAPGSLTFVSHHGKLQNTSVRRTRCMFEGLEDRVAFENKGVDGKRTG